MRQCCVRSKLGVGFDCNTDGLEETIPAEHEKASWRLGVGARLRPCGFYCVLDD